MALTAPDWLTKRGGALQRGPEGHWYVVFSGEPQYRLSAVPAGGQHGCAVVQTINGRLVRSNCKAATADAAILAGLEELRKSLGW
jgi:hypothetical protein